MTTPANYTQAFAEWQAKRLAALKAPDGWLNIIGRFWLENGTVTVGTAPDNDLVLSAGPEHVGSLTQDSAGVKFTAADGSAPFQLQLNKAKPPQFTVGSLLLEVTTLNGENALRVRDTASTAPNQLGEIDRFPLDPNWRIVAQWIKLDTPQGLTVDTTKSIPTDVQVTHKAIFTHGSATYELLPTHGTLEAPQFVLRDLTSRDSTYQASRFLYGEDVGTDTIVLDFNKAINPPCAFTEHAVCPLPPPENVMPFRIEAGEKRLSGH